MCTVPRYLGTSVEIVIIHLRLADGASTSSSSSSGEPSTSVCLLCTSISFVWFLSLARSHTNVKARDSFNTFTASISQTRIYHMPFYFSNAVAFAVAAVTVAADSSGLHSFVSIGDWGGAGLEDYHKTDEITVAGAFAKTAASLDAQFVLNTGDNFYYYGVKSTDDPMWQNTYEQIYTQDALKVKWYGVLGNHDYGFNPVAQTQYKSPNNDRWVLPSPYYTKRVQIGDTSQYVSLIMIDTSPCVSDYRGEDKSKWDPCGTEYPGPSDCAFHDNILKQNCSEQFAWLQETVKKIPDDDWKIAVGHHPADEINVEDLTSLLQSIKVDLYLNGHTHEMAQYSVDNNPAYVTTGGGCMVKVEGHDESAYDHARKMRAKNGEQEVAKTIVDARGHVEMVDADGHSYDSVWFKRVAGYTAHTFSQDLSELNTTFYDGYGKRIRSFVVKKGQAPAPGPSPGPGPSPSPTGKCCYHDEAVNNPDCTPGAVCCKSHCSDPSECSYAKEGCNGYYGKKHHCQWEDDQGICVVGSGLSSD